ncbi:MAG: hypothetical protein IPJ51_16380 [Saprospiraceae bacterium]|jgi:hypothetical protein|nr:hypothetical protein [Saprospiraceae bacterium]
MSNHNIIDSNIIAIANGLHNTASLECMNNSILFLKQIEERVMSNNDVFLIYDTSFVILKEYFNHCGKGTEKRLGTAFYKWIHRNINNPNKFILHKLPVDIDDNNDLLPPCFHRFDRNDRKYLSLALNFKEFRPSLHYGIDRGYPNHGDCFEDENIELSKLC